VEGFHAVNRPDRRSGPDELTRLLAVPRTDTEELACGQATGGWASAAVNCVSRQRLRRSSRLISRNPGEPLNNRPFTRLLGSTRVENRPVRRATPVRPIESVSCDVASSSARLSDKFSMCCVCSGRAGRFPQPTQLLAEWRRSRMRTAQGAARDRKSITLRNRLFGSRGR